MCLIQYIKQNKEFYSKALWPVHAGTRSVLCFLAQLFTAVDLPLRCAEAIIPPEWGI